jgi:hypothetical protein
MGFCITKYWLNCAVLFENDFLAYGSETLVILEAFADRIACLEVHWNVLCGGV